MCDKDGTAEAVGATDLLDVFDVFSLRQLHLSDVPHLYLSYQESMGATTESEFKASLEANRMILLEDDTGTGKSSMLRYVLHEVRDTHFPILHRVGLDDQIDAICSKQSEFAKYVLSRIIQAVSAFKKLDQEAVNRYKKYLSGEISYSEGRKDTLVTGVKSRISPLPQIVSIEAEVTAELATFSNSAYEEKLYNEDRLECIRGICEIIRNAGRMPVLVFDDTDHFISQVGVDRTALIEPFFGEIVLKLFTELDCAIILTSDTRYGGTSVYDTARKDVFNTRIYDVPELPLEGFVALVAKRIQSVLPQTNVDDVFDSAALEYLYSAVYQKKHRCDIRSAVSILAGAVATANEQGLDRVSEALMKDTMIERAY